MRQHVRIGQDGNPQDLEGGLRRAAFDFALDAMVVADDDGRYVEGNAAAAELFGVEVGDLPGVPVHQFANAEPEAVQALWRQLLEQGELRGEYEVRRADGGLRNVEFSARAHVLPGRHLIVVRDTTERQRSVEEARRLEAALQQAQKLDLVGQLAGGLAHDFNNILAVILNNAQFALDELTGHPAAEDVATIKAAAERATALTRQLLLFSRRDIPAPGRVDVARAIEEVHQLMQRTIGRRLDFGVELADDLPAVEIDPNHLQQVLMNLVVNARDAMPDGGTLRIAAETLMLDDERADRWGLARAPHVRISVHDTGVGMTPDVLQHALEPFFTTKARGTGTGLGLATVYGIVTQHRGHIELDSEPGHGTVAAVYLPAAGAARPAPPDDEPANAPPAGEGRVVLLVEDDPAVREAARRLLTGEDYRVLPAASPGEALELARRHPVDVVLTDVVMPGMSGHDLVGRLRAEHPGLRAVYMSGRTEWPEALAAESTFVGKPFTRDALLRALSPPA